jgi:hypothetical protein
MLVAEMSRIFDHKKQYVCTELFRLDELQEAIAELEDLVEPDTQRFYTAAQRLFALSGAVKEALSTFGEFITNLEEQEKRK